MENSKCNIANANILGKSQNRTHGTMVSPERAERRGQTSELPPRWRPGVLDMGGNGL